MHIVAGAVCRSKSTAGRIRMDPCFHGGCHYSLYVRNDCTCIPNLNMRPMDTLMTHATEGIPEIGIRISVEVILAFAVAFLILLLYFRMKEHDQRIGI